MRYVLYPVLLIACGLVGCGGGKERDGGAPPPTDAGFCGPSNCRGCCSASTCLAGNASSACGSGGEMCSDCGPTRLCKDGSCELDPASRWDIVLRDGEVPTDNYEGGEWDPFGGAPDPYVHVTVDNEEGPTADSLGSCDCGDTFNPDWEGYVLMSNVRADAIKSLLRFAMWDRDPDSDDWIGACFIENISDDAFDGSVQTMRCEEDPSIELSGFTLRFELRRH